jgi:hypothetical protein
LVFRDTRLHQIQSPGGLSAELIQAVPHLTSHTIIIDDDCASIK